MKPSELTAEDIAVFTRKIMDKADYAKLPDSEKADCTAALAASKGYVSAYTGLDLGTSVLEDITYAVCVIAAEMIDSRQMTVQYATENPTAKQIMDLHSMNLLPTPDIV